MTAEDMTMTPHTTLDASAADLRAVAASFDCFGVYLETDF